MPPKKEEAESAQPPPPPAPMPIHPECGGGGAPAPPAPAAGAEGGVKKGFLFDIIVVRLDLAGKLVPDPTKIQIDVMFYNLEAILTSNRINVLDFPPQPVLEFFDDPLTLRESLERTPLRLKVFTEEQVYGYAKFDWPPKFLDGLIDCAKAMEHSGETELKDCNGTRTGAIQIIARLQPRCEEFGEDTSPAGKCRNANKEIRPTDILFVVGEDKNPCCCSEVGIIPATDSEHDMGPRCLDLSNFRCLNSQTVPDVDVLNSIDPACQKIKTVANQYEKILCALKSAKKVKCTTNVDDNPCDLFQSSSESLHMPICGRTESRPFTKQSIHIPKVMTPPELTVDEPEPLRRCPLCQENLSYLPKLAACPNCCYKPIPHFDEKPYNVDKNAENIIKEFEDGLQDDDSNSGYPKCRCTCQNNVDDPCPRCRVRKQVEEFYKPPSESLLRKNAGAYELKSSETICPSADSRPFLSKIFSELKDLHDIKEPKKKEFTPDERCEKELNKQPLRVKKPTKAQSDEVEQHKQEITPTKKCKRRAKKRYLRPASEKAARSRLYVYEGVRQIVPINVGHKTCINGFAGRKNVPPNMGWLWNINQPKKWKPGAIRRPIKELMKYFLKDFPADTLLVSKYCFRKARRNKNSQSPVPKLVQKPTLHIYKHNGEFIVTMRPLKCQHLLKDAADPYEDMKPIQFRITKNPRLTEIRKIKQFLKDMGFKKCTCHKPIIYCYCRSFLDKKRLEYLCKKECMKRKISSCCDTLVLSDTSDSEAEFNFGVTPPAAIIKPERLQRLDLVNVSTQYNEMDWNSMPLFPRPPNKYMQMYQCAIAERRAKRLPVGPFGRGKPKPCKAGGGGGGGGGGDGKGGGKGKIGGKGKASEIKVKLCKRATKKKEEPPQPSRKVDMMKYVLKMNKKNKLSPVEAAAKRRARMDLLRGVSPPILCMVDRRGKPYEPCGYDIRIC